MIRMGHSTFPAVSWTITTFRADRNIKVPDTAFRSSAMDISVNCLLKRWCPCRAKMSFRFFLFHPVIQETVITDLLETGWKHMHQEPPDEFCMLQGDLTFRLAGLFAPGREGDLLFRDGKDTAVRTGDLMGVSSKGLNGISKTMKGFFDVRTPILFIKFIFPVLPFMGSWHLLQEEEKLSLLSSKSVLSRERYFPLNLSRRTYTGMKNPPACLPDLMGFA